MNNNFENYFLHVKACLKNLGYRESLKREYIIRILFETKKFLNAEEIKEILYKKYSESISLSMVYKHISLFKTLKLVRSVKSNNENERYKIDTLQNKHFLVCLTCKKVEEIDSTKTKKLVKKVTDRYDFTLLECSLKMYGYCRECCDE